MNDFLRRIADWFGRVSARTSSGLATTSGTVRKHADTMRKVSIVVTLAIVAFLVFHFRRLFRWLWKNRGDVIRSVLGLTVLAIGVVAMWVHRKEVPWLGIAVVLGLVFAAGLGLWFLIWVSYKLAEWNDRRKAATPTPAFGRGPR